MPILQVMAKAPKMNKMLTPTKTLPKNSKSIIPSTFKRVKQKIISSVRAKSAHQGHCWTLYQKQNGRGHSQIKVDNIKYLAHRIMACEDKYVEYDKVVKNDASHLCGNHDCVNPDHLYIVQPN